MKFLQKQNLINFITIQFISFYQNTFSYFFGGHCRFEPSCSHFALQAFKKYNFKKAFFLTSLRLCSCHPFTKKSFYDPVP